jgi:uncharacterized membrane protein YccC
MVTQRLDDDFPFDGDEREPAPADEQFDRERDRESEPDREARRRRKERVLHTRISEQLSEDIRRAAEDLRVPASNLVRNVLEEAFGAVERVSDEVGEFLEEMLSDADGARGDLRRIGRRFQELARRQRRRFAGFARSDEPAAAADDSADRDDAVEAPRAAAEAAPEPPPPPPAPTFPEVIGWQPLLANSACACAACTRPIAAGDRAFAGATERGLSRTFLCAACMRARSGA